MLEAVDFVFIVQDRNGVKSDPVRLVVASVDDFYKGLFDLGGGFLAR